VISIIVNCHNGLEYLVDALDSVIRQTERDWELIFWDNASEQSAEALVRRYADPRIRYVYDHEFVPLGEARNRALKLAKGEYVAFLDVDDYWMPEKLARQLALFEASPRVGLVYSDAYIVHAGKVTKRVFARHAPPEGDVFSALLGSYFLVMSSVMIRRAALDALPVWFDPRFEIIEEYDLFLRIAASWEFRCAAEVLAAWRWHDGSTTMRKRRMISIEKRMLLKKLHAGYPGLMGRNRNAVSRVIGKIMVSLALAQYYAGRPHRARRVLRCSRRWTPKGVFVFFATFLPIKLVDGMYRMLKGNPLV
jgi:glycosyltransferase involved in cell wall biosynthesis